MQAALCNRYATSELERPALAAGLVPRPAPNAGARKVLAWLKRRQLACAFRWEDSYKGSNGWSNFWVNLTSFSLYSAGHRRGSVWHALQAALAEGLMAILCMAIIALCAQSSTCI